MTEKLKNGVSMEEETFVGVVEEAEQDRIKVTQFIEDVTADADQIQKKILTEILTRNVDVEYLQRHGIKGRIDHETFKKLIPVISYEDIKSDIDRIFNGDTSPILCSEPIAELFLSSATSGGDHKLFPMTKQDSERRFDHWVLPLQVMSQYIPDFEKGKGLYFLFIKPEIKTPGGLTVNVATTSLFKSSRFQEQRHYYLNFTSPIETIHCSDYYQSKYSQLLCGLCQRKQVLRIGAAFAIGFIQVIRFLENHWPLLCNDIRTGTLNPKITDPSVREAVMKILKRPDPQLADCIEAECDRSSWQGVIPRLWPNAKYIDTINTGSMSQYIPTLNYYGDGLPLVSSRYVTTESHMGVNLNPLCKPNEVSYTLIPTFNYFEFLPVHREIDQSVDSFLERKTTILDVKIQRELVDLVDVKLGQEYEPIITTYSGLYRYRLGDILRVTGFKNNSPQFSFVCRKNAVLNIDAEKTDELEIQKAFNNSVKHLQPYHVTVREYTHYADTSSVPGHYVLYWELNESSTPVPSSAFQDCCVSFEESLNKMYLLNRVVDNSIGPLELKIVQSGTFDKLMDQAINLGASVAQYKTPICVKSPRIVELLNSSVVSTYFSPRFPQYEKLSYGLGF